MKIFKREKEASKQDLEQEQIPEYILEFYQKVQKVFNSIENNSKASIEKVKYKDKNYSIKIDKTYLSFDLIYIRDYSLYSMIEIYYHNNKKSYEVRFSFNGDIVKKSIEEFDKNFIQNTGFLLDTINIDDYKILANNLEKDFFN